MTGGTGFVGSHIAETLLASGFSVRALVRRPHDPGWLKGLDVEKVQGDVRNPDGLEAFVRGCCAVVHAAGKTSARNEAGYFEANETGTRRMAEAVACAAPDAHFVLISSLAAAGPSLDGERVKADSPARPVSTYGRSKLAGEEALRRVAGLSYTILRPSAVYGPRETAIRDLFVMASRGLVPVLAGGKPRIQMAYVKDVSSAVAAAVLKGGQKETFFVAHPEILNYAHLADVLARLRSPEAKKISISPLLIRAGGLVAGLIGALGSGPPVFNSEKADEMLQKAWICDVDGLQQSLGSPMRTSFEEGAKETWHWYIEAGWIKR